MEEWAEEAAEPGRAGALPKESGKKARIASSSISAPSAMGTRSPPARSASSARGCQLRRDAGSCVPKPVERVGACTKASACCLAR